MTDTEHCLTECREAACARTAAVAWLARALASSAVRASRLLRTSSSSPSCAPGHSVRWRLECARGKVAGLLLTQHTCRTRLRSRERQ